MAATSANGAIVIATANGADGTAGADCSGIPSCNGYNGGSGTAGRNLVVGTVGTLTGVTTTTTGDIALTAGNGGAGGVGGLGPVSGGMGGTGAAGGVVILNAALNGAGAAVLTSGRGGNGGSAGWYPGGDLFGGLGGGAGVGGSISVNSGISIAGALSLAAGSGGNGGNGYLWDVRVNGGSGGSITLGTNSVNASGISLTAGAGGQGGASSFVQGNNTGITGITQGGSGGAGGNITVATSMTSAGGMALVAGAGGQGISADIGATAGVGGTGGSIAVSAALNSASALTLTSGSGGAGGAAYAPDYQVSGATGNSGNATLAAGGSVASAASGDAVVVATAGNFVNNAGSSAISAASGRWLVYSTSPASDTFGGLLSGNTAIWGTAYNSASPSQSQTGNRYVFSVGSSSLAGIGYVQANSLTKTYGSAATLTYTSYAGNSGAVYGNAFTDAGSAGPVLNGGTPLTSTGAAGTASVGSYGITLNLSGVSASGFSSLVSLGNGTLTINKAHLTVTADNQSRVYGATNPTFTETISGFVNGENASVVTGSGTGSSTAINTTNVGTATITASNTGLSASNYDFSNLVNGTLTINKAALTVTANAASTTYSGLAYSGGNGVSYSGFMNGETSAVLGGTVAYGGTSQTATNAGSYLITPSGLTSGNYSLSYTNGTLTINPATLTVTANAASRLYGATNPALSGTVTGFVNGELLANVTSGTEIFSTSALGSSNVGNYAITGSGLTANNGNYVFVQAAGNSAALTINKAHLTVTADNQSRLYGAANPTFTETISGFVNGENASVVSGTGAGSSTAINTTNVGTATITASNTGLSASNYDFSNLVNGTLTINKAALTVTANAASTTYNGVAYSGGNGVGYSGFVNSETSAVLGGSLAYGGTSQGATNAGSYVITPSGLTSGNYSFNYADGALTINKALLTVTGSAVANKIYDGGTAATLFGGVLSGVIAADAANVSLAQAGSFGSKNVGTGIAVTATDSLGGTAASNYSLTQPVRLSADITAKALTVTATGANKVYDGTIADAVTLADNRIAGDVLTLANTSATFADKNVANGKAVTVSGINVTGTDAGNYTFNTTTATTANITPATLSYTATPASLVAGQAPSGLTGTITGLVAGDTLASSTTGIPAWTSSAGANSQPGHYAIDGSGLMAANYVFAQDTGNATALTLQAGTPPANVSNTTASLQSMTTMTGGTSSNSNTSTGQGSGSTSSGGTSTNSSASTNSNTLAVGNATTGQSTQGSGGSGSTTNTNKDSIVVDTSLTSGGKVLPILTVNGGVNVSADSTEMN